MTRETKSYELKIYDQSLMRFEAPMTHSVV